MKSFTLWRTFFSHFWDRHPALFLGFCFLLGTATVFAAPFLFISLFVCLLVSNKRHSSLFIASFFFLIAIFSASLRSLPHLPEKEQTQGSGQFHIHTIKIQSSAFHKSLVYEGRLTTFTSQEDKTYFNLPCRIYLPVYSSPPKHHCDYRLEGKLFKKNTPFFILKPTKNIDWQPIKNTWTLAIFRHLIKQKIRKILAKEMKDPSVRTLLGALATGEIDERRISMEFGKIGLQHILAISGFHFALVALLLHILCKCFLPYQLHIPSLLIALTGYYVFLGDSPSIQRAYIMVILFLLSKWIHRSVSALNTLGVAILIELAIDPSTLIDLSFQLTFLSTLAILLFYTPFETLFKKVLPDKNSSEIEHLSLINRHGYFLSVLIRKSFAINFSVTFLSLPVLLYLFHKFPLLSLLYNLFCPACICISMLLVCLSLLFHPLLPFLSHWIHVINHSWTHLLLKIIANPPAVFDFALRTNKLPFWFVVTFVSLALFFAIFLEEKRRSSKSLL